MKNLRETVAWALFNAAPLRWENYPVASLSQLPQQERQTLLGEADAALAAVGLDDLDAAVNRARFFHAGGNYLRNDTRRLIARNVLELALTATTSTGETDG